MGLFDFIRRRFDASPQPADTGSGSADPHVSSGSADTQADHANGIGDSTGYNRDSQGGDEDAPPNEVLPAWSLLPPITPVSAPTISRSFDVDISKRLRAHRSADDLLASRSLGHTVNPSSIGVVGGLVNVVSRATTFPTHKATGDLVLRRRVLRGPELAEADHAHPKWPVLARSVAAPASSGQPALAGPSHDENSFSTLTENETVLETSPSGFANSGDTRAVDRSVGEEANSVSDGSIEAGVSSLAAASGRTLPNVSVAGFSAPISRLSDDRLSSLSSSLSTSAARTVSIPVDSVGTLGRTQTQSIATGDSSASSPLSSTNPGGPSADSSIIKRNADPQSAARTLRRRSIVEIPAANAGRADRSADVTGDGPTDSSDGGNIARVADAAGSPIGASRLTHSTPDGSTLGRRIGLGEPLSSLPPTAVLRTADDHDDALSAWGRGLTGDLPLASSDLLKSTSVGTDGGSATNAGGPGEMKVRRGSGTDNSGAESAQPVDVGLLGSSLQRSAASEGDLPLRVSSSGETSAASVGTNRLRDTSAVAIATLPIVSRSTASIARSTNRDSTASGHNDSTGADSSEVGSSDVGSSDVGSSDVGDVRGHEGFRSDEGQPSGTFGRALSGEQKAMTSVRTDPILSAFDVPEVLSASPRNTPALLRTIDSPVTAAASGRGTKSNVSRSANPLQTNVAPTVGGGSVVGSTDSVVARTLAPNAGAPNPSSSQSTGFADGPVGMRTFEQIAATEGLPGALPLRSTASNGPFVLNRAWDGSAAASRSAQPRASSTSSNPGTTNTDSPGFSWTTDAYQVLQREADAQGSSGGAATPTATATSEAGPSPMAAGAPPQGSSTQAEADLELLAGRLYERLRYRFRRELLDDRERAGLVLDRVR